MGFIVKKGISNIYVLFSIIILISVFVSIFVIANNSDKIQNQPYLAPTINGKSIGNQEVKQYLDSHDNFKDITYDILQPNDEKHYILRVENKEDTIRGVQIDDEKYVIDLVFCHFGTQTCIFKVNGVNTPPFHAYREALTNEHAVYRINNRFDIKLNSIIFDKCDNARFCNMHFEGYNEVNLTVIGDEI